MKALRMQQKESKISHLLLFYDDGVVEQRDYLFNKKIGPAMPINKNLISLLTRSFHVKEGNYRFKSFIPGHIKYVQQDPYLKMIWTSKAGVYDLEHVDKKYSGKYYLPNLCFVLKDTTLNIYSYQSYSSNSYLYKVDFPNMFQNNELCKGTAKLHLDKCKYWEDIAKNGSNVFYKSRFSHEVNKTHFKYLKDKHEMTQEMKEIIFHESLKVAKVYEVL